MKTEKVKAGQIEYTITELTVRYILPLIEKVDEKNLTLEISKLCVSVNGKPIGDAILDLSFSVYQKIMIAVNSVHGFGEEKND